MIDLLQGNKIRDLDIPMVILDGSIGIAVDGATQQVHPADHLTFGVVVLLAQPDDVVPKGFRIGDYFHGMFYIHMLTHGRYTPLLIYDLGFTENVSSIIRSIQNFAAYNNAVQRRKTKK